MDQNNNKKPGVFVTALTIIILCPIIFFVLNMLAWGICIAIVGVIAYVIYHMWSKKNSYSEESFVIENPEEKRREDYQFYQQFIDCNVKSENNTPNVKENVDTYNLEFEDTVESFDQSFFQTLNFIETFSSFKKQNQLFNDYFNELENLRDVSDLVKERIKNAKEYVNYAQDMKEHLGFLKGSQTGLNKEIYYRWMSLADNKKYDNENQVYLYCEVVFPYSSKTYAYLTDDKSVKVGEQVVVPVGDGDIEKVGTIVSIGQYLKSSAPYPPELTKTIIKKADFES